MKMTPLDPVVVYGLIIQMRAHLERRSKDALVLNMLQEVANAMEGEFYPPIYLHRLGELASSPTDDSRIGTLVIACVVLRLALGQKLTVQYETLLRSAYDLLILPAI